MSRRNDVLRAVGACALALAFSTNAPAQIVGEGKPTAGQVDQAATITLDVADRPLEDVLDHIRNKVGVTIVTPPGTEGRVTIKLKDIPWQEALRFVAESANCIVTMHSPRLARVEKPPRVTMSFQAVDIKQVIEAIAKAGNANIVVSDKVKGNVTMVIADKPWRDALDAVVKTQGYFLVEEERGILRVVDENGLATHVERRLFPLRYLRPKGTYIAKIDTDYVETRMTRNQQQGGGNQSATEQAKKTFPLLEALQNMLSKDGKIDYFDDQNSILVKDTKPVLDEIGHFLEQLDIEPVQIHIDVKFVTTTKQNSLDVSFGVNHGVDMSVSGASRPSRFPFNLGPGSLADNLLPGRTDDNTIIAPVTASPVTPGILDFSATSLAIKLVKQDQSAQFVQAPKITTVDHREATIFVGETIRYAQAEAASSQSGGLTLSVREADHSPVDTGFQLLVIPQVVPGSNKILMTVIPQARTLSGTTDPAQPGFDLFTVGAGTAGSGSISLPRVASETIVTNMMLENGQTGIIGGLVQTQKTKSEEKVPWLGDIPVLGALFRSTTDTETERGLLVFITPWIVGSSEKTEDRVKALIEQYQQNAGHEWEMFAGAQS